ncbi:methylamine utilization protein [Herbaspirillum sp. RTI4]|uniref:methylamine utilization protein n=1 Tax=Herbaspirillum sp. RTI4 TaxID=3048640 RepID=UPI002AB486D0|nr:methylamine utilization protein [Herbaspirillum sp. RTI4]MDY7578899.1 methylamine utilization protein [Herbaspirillum sp. RTI4]MEA9981988.1 methylamine utilization protein [Herbaspirillum sp. RTI4]
MRSQFLRRWTLISLLLTALLWSSSAVCLANSITVHVLDATGRPVPNAVVYVEAASGQTLPKPLKQAEIEQRELHFQPLVTVVQTGTSILFPNNDKVRHHVYSFSPAKPFELKLYSGVPGNAILFDKPGTVVVGCNIHDSMVAYIHIVNTPYFSKTDAAGMARLPELVSGKYRLKAWYFTMQGDTVPEQSLDYQGGDTSANVKLSVKVSL